MSYLLIPVGLALLFFAMSLRYVPSQPPHIAVVTLLGKRLRKVKTEGLRLFPFYPFLFGSILIDMSKKNQDLPTISVVTPDLGRIAISASTTWSPLPTHAIEYLDHGGEQGIQKILADSAQEALRNWAAASEGGPSGWVEALKTGSETTPILMTMLAGLAPDLSSDARAELTRKLRTGEGIPMPQLGILLNRLNIRALSPSGTIVKATEAQKVVQQLRQTMNISDEQAFELIQIQPGEVPKKIEEFKVNISPATLAAVMGVIEKFSGRKS